MRRGTTKGKGETFNSGVMLRGGMGGTSFDEYVERPRPNMFNVLKKLKDSNNDGGIVNRLCYIAKVSEGEFKGDMNRYEREFTKWTEKVCYQEEVPVGIPDVDFRENYFEETTSA